MDENIREGHYAKKQLLNPISLIRWSHRARFQRALELIQPCNGLELLDFGCGDGTFLAMLLGGGAAPASALGAELHQATLDDNRRRFAHVPSLDFILQSELDTPAHHGRYDVLTCMEVLEHVTDTMEYLMLFHRLLKPGGRLLISVPVEIGPAVVIKQSARQVAGWLRAGDYPGVTPYTWGELISSVFAGARQHVVRPINRDADGFESHCHKGFNWKALKNSMESSFSVRKIGASPLAWLPPGCNSQVWIDATRS